eukprot:Skav205391  [mRNA]  locus=scaffold1642:47655:49943:- [translate_table: standard]
MALEHVEPYFRGDCQGEYSVVIDPICRQSNGHVIAVTVLHRQRVCVADNGTLQGRTTLFRYQCDMSGDLPLLSPTAEASIMKHPHAFHADFTKCIEACAGIAAVTQGYAACGVSTVVHVEESQAFADVLRRRGCQVIQGDVADQATIQQMANHRAAIASAGVSCQPFSSLGDQLQHLDARSKSMPAMIRVTYLLQLPVLILECTQQAMTSPWVQDLLAEFSQKMGMGYHQKILDIGDFWPARRQRWWCVMFNRFLEVDGIPDYPQFPFKPCILHVMPRFLTIHDQNMEDLVLDVHELAEFSSRPTMDKHLCDSCKQLPTATHSWGSQLHECPCGCRSGGFRSARLDSKGLYGQLVVIPEKDAIKLHIKGNAVRHMHAKEVALLNGLDPRTVEAHPSKLMLAGVGQLASPLQGGWVLAHVLQSIHRNFMPLPHAEDPMKIMQNMIQLLFQARDEEFHGAPTHLTNIFQQAHETWGSESIVPLEAHVAVPEMPTDSATSTTEVNTPVEASPHELNQVVPEHEHPRCDEVPAPFASSETRALTDTEPESAAAARPEAPKTPPNPYGGLFATGFGSPGLIVPSPPDSLDANMGAFLDEVSNSDHCDDAEEPIPKRQCIRTTEAELAQRVSLDPGNKAYVVFPGAGVHTVSFAPGTTIGNLSVASAQLQQCEQINKITTAMGSPVTLQEAIQPGQFLRVAALDEPDDDQLIPHLCGSTRANLLWDQQGWVATDEMNHYLEAIECTHPGTIMGVKAVPPDADEGFIIS